MGGRSTLIRLTRGATGFRGPHEAPLPRTEAALFRAACFTAAMEARGRAGEVVPGEVQTFRRATLSDGYGRVFTALGHVHLPLVAFTTDAVREGEPVPGFADPPLWAQVFETAGLRVMGVKELMTPLEECDVSELSPAELTEIRYWKPACLGDVLFNWWD
ncbi:hypothetical protein B7P34_15785 [Streptosporangium nondiastaticum]|uniref:Uncharacterized protein n=1 Tax=Streptosporangium nondiastaticum TaxID=35764 RepID=A0A9X7PH64_9ACTN|nr:hypothetical protein B7P34_15785 [Streptosporangium nondiastaticum]